jgi:hypothetical protein
MPVGFGLQATGYGLRASTSSPTSNRADCTPTTWTGKPLWQTDFGDKRMRNQSGEGSTPALYRNLRGYRKLFSIGTP